MSVVRGRQAGADVQELTDPGLARQVTDRAAQERPVSASIVADTGVESSDLVTDLAVYGVIVRAA